VGIGQKVSIMGQNLDKKISVGIKQVKETQDSMKSDIKKMNREINLKVDQLSHKIISTLEEK
jgi:hypothetical protein